VFARFGRGCVIVALVLSTGAHWAALQTVAWTAMLATNFRAYSLSEAVIRTFDGKHPCSLCRAVAAGQKSERKSESLPPVQKFECLPLQVTFFLVAPSDFELMPGSDTFATIRFLEPPTPPPRRCFV